MKYPVELKEVFFAKGKTLFPIKGQHSLLRGLSTELEKVRNSFGPSKRVHHLKAGFKKKKKSNS